MAEMATHSSFSIKNNYQYFVSMTTIAETLVLHNYLVKKEGKPFFLCLMNLDSHFSQAAKAEEVYLRQTCLSRNQHKICL
jgi:hypothetical protein